MSESVNIAEVTDDIAREISARLHDVREALKNEDIDTLYNVITPLHAADQAEVLNHLSSPIRREVTLLLEEGFNQDILPDLSAEAADDVFDVLGLERSAEALSQLDTDDAVHIIEEMNEMGQQEFLDAVPERYREDLEQGLSYPEDSAGRLMNKKLVSVPSFWTVGDTIDYLRARDDLPNRFYVIYVTDPRYHPIGRLVLGTLMRHKRGVLVSNIMDQDTFAMSTQMDQEDVAHQFRKYGLVEAPVINNSERLVGTITVDDVVDVIREEEEEDFMLRGGVKVQDLQASLVETVHHRFPWLFVNLLTAVLASVVIGVYADTIEQLVALAVLMPIVASMGGNAGTQSVTVAVRAIATRQLNDTNRIEVIRKELLTGFANGLCLACIMGGGAFLWYSDVELALVFSGATLLTLTIAGISGALVPIILTRVGVDPAVASGVFLTTITDVVGFLSFLGFAAFWLF